MYQMKWQFRSIFPIQKVNLGQGPRPNCDDKDQQKYISSILGSSFFFMGSILGSLMNRYRLYW